MTLWQIWAIVGLLFLVIKLTTPTLFFLNLALGAVSAAITAYFTPNVTVQVVVFIITSTILLLFLSPLLVGKNKAKEKAAGIEEQYIGRQAQVIQKIGEEGTSGVGKIKIHGEVFDAKSEDGGTIEPFEMVEIVRNESPVMFVKRQEEKNAL